MLPNLPPELEPYRAAIESTLRPCVNMYIHPIEPDRPEASRIGGRPYWPEGMEYPRDPLGVPMYLQAQINFAEVPPLPDFPEKGILQWFISPTFVDDNSKNERLVVFGLDWKKPFHQDFFRLIYWPDASAKEDKEAEIKWQSEIELRNKLENMLDSIYGNIEYSFPLFEMNRACKIEFLKVEMPITTFDFRYSNYLPSYEENKIFNCKYYEWINEKFNSHRINGYPLFIQNDDREFDNEIKKYELFLQFSSDQYQMWGDAGVGGLFILPEDLQRCDFSRVYYYWDCS